MNTTHIFRILCGFFTFLVSSSWAQTTVSTYLHDGGVGAEWSVIGCWDNGLPSGAGFEAVLPASVTDPVFLDSSRTVGALTVGAGTTLRMDEGRGLSLVGDVLNDGLVELTGLESAFSRLFFSHPLLDIFY